MDPRILVICVGIAAGSAAAPKIAHTVKHAAVKVEHAVLHGAHAVRVVATLPVLLLKTSRQEHREEEAAKKAK